jgi:hypothetical protein
VIKPKAAIVRVVRFFGKTELVLAETELNLAVHFGKQYEAGSITLVTKP